jgi:hypothetical protein
MFRFSIRDVLWLTVVVALGVVWVAERPSRARMRMLEWKCDQLQDILETEGFAIQLDNDGIRARASGGNYHFRGAPSGVSPATDNRP